jgi:hemoglobin-like flavoprotein
MTPEQIDLVQSTWTKVAPIADQAADIFYDRLFEIAPEARPLFAEDMTKQKRALMGMLATAVNGLKKLDTILPAVQALGERHVGYGTKDEHYDIVASALLFTGEVEEAWTKAYVTLATVMKDSAAKVQPA